MNMQFFRQLLACREDSNAVSVVLMSRSCITAAFTKMRSHAHAPRCCRIARHKRSSSLTRWPLPVTMLLEQRSALHVGW